MSQNGQTYLMPTFKACIWKMVVLTSEVFVKHRRKVCFTFYCRAMKILSLCGKSRQRVKENIEAESFALLIFIDFFCERIKE